MFRVIDAQDKHKFKFFESPAFSGAPDQVTSEFPGHSARIKAGKYRGNRLSGNY
jgi:hypothetical protein